MSFVGCGAGGLPKFADRGEDDWTYVPSHLVYAYPVSC
jgi:hypothetical protein